MEVKIKNQNELIDATIEMVDGIMVVSPKEVKFEPKDGDVCKSINCIYIFKRVKPSRCYNRSAIVYYCCYNGDYLKVQEDVGVGYIERQQRYATEEEKKMLFDKLAEEGLEWDAEKKQLVKLKWKPEYKEFYFRITFEHAVIIPHRTYWTDDICDKAYYQKGWCFKTKEECQAFCDRLNESISSIKP